MSHHGCAWVWCAGGGWGVAHATSMRCPPVATFLPPEAQRHVTSHVAPHVVIFIIGQTMVTMALENHGDNHHSIIVSSQP